ncbi:MAG TPA: hypothetical protein VFP55_02350 [Solirubrobacteraceae bacterium]|nr:hypothetical protein [Solirubrobacteraceae bacterium]
MEESAAQILEVRPAEVGGDASITFSVSSQASQAALVALSEQLDRRRAAPLESAEDVQELRQATELVERCEALAATGAHAVVHFSPEELRACLVELTGYVERMDVDGFQPPELRERLRVIGQITPVLWDANAAASRPMAPLPS